MRPTLALFQRACVICAASSRHKFLNLHRWVCTCAALSSHRGLDKHATLRRRWKAACLCLVSLSVFCFFALQLDWHGLSNNMAGRQYESLPGFYPLKWFLVTFLIFFKGLFYHLLFYAYIFSFAPSHASLWFWKANAIHIEMLCCLKPDQNNCFDMSFLFSLAVILMGFDFTMRIKDVFEVCWLNWARDPLAASYRRF